VQESEVGGGALPAAAGELNFKRAGLRGLLRGRAARLGGAQLRGEPVEQRVSLAALARLVRELASSARCASAVDACG